MRTKTGQIGVAVVATVLVCGCGTPVTPNRPAASGTQKVTFAVKDMGQRLGLLWDDWPNRVEQALSGLEGVELAEDVWDSDLVHVKYDASKISVEQMLQTIEKQGFQAKVQRD